MRILFLHGLEGSPNGTKARYLKQRYGPSNVVAPEWRVSDRVSSCLDAIVSSTSDLQLDNDLIVVGSSFGGFLATLLREKIRGIDGYVLINPALVEGPRKELLDLFSDLRSFPIEKIRDRATAVLLGNQDDICDPNASEAFFKNCGHVIRVDEDHRFSKPESLNLMAETIEHIRDNLVILGMPDDDDPLIRQMKRKTWQRPRPQENADS